MAKLPRVCILTETYHPVIGGGETQARLFARSLAEAGISVIILTRRTDKSLKKHEHYGSINVIRLPPVGSEHYKKWGLLITSFIALIKMASHYDLVFVSGFRVVGIAAVLASKLLRKVCILKADSLGEMSGDFFADGLIKLRIYPTLFLFRIFLSLRNKLLQQADAFVAISSAVQAELQFQGVRPGKIHSISNSVDIKKFHPVTKEVKVRLRRKLDLPEDDKIFIYTGRLVSYKGLPLLLEVWYEIHQRHKNVILLLVGSGGLDIHNCEQELRGFVKAKGLQDSVRFTGDVESVHEYLQASDVFVFPTEREAFGISVVEAMACKLPIIATDIGGLKDILIHKRNGLVVRSGDFQALYSSMAQLIDNDPLSVTLGNSAWQTVSERYSTTKMMHDYIRLFKRSTYYFG